MRKSKYRRKSPSTDDRPLRRALVSALVGGLIREALTIAWQEVWRGGHW
jgi:hypothetical protein